MRLAVILLALGVPLGRALSQCPDGSPPPCTVAVRRPGPPPASVAVLPFDATRDSAGGYVADGLVVELTARLGSIQRLALSSRTAVQRFRGAATSTPQEIGRALGVSYLVTGNLTRAAGRRRVEVELVRTANGTRVWGGTYDGASPDIVEQVARSVAGAVLGTLQAEERSAVARRGTRNRAAYDFYLRTFGPLELRAAQAYLDSALGLDPLFAAARGRLATFHASRLNAGEYEAAVQDSIVALGFAAADSALALDSASADAWLARSWFLMFRNYRDYAGAEAAALRAAQLDPAHPDVWNQLETIRRRTGDFPGALAASRRDQSANPQSPGAWTEAAFSHASLRDYREALAELDTALARDSTVETGLRWRSYLRLLTGDTAGARADAIAWQRLNPTNEYQIPMLRVEVAARGEAAARLWRTRILRLAERDRTGPVGVRRSWYLAETLLLAGERERSLDVLERTTPRGAWLWSYLVLPMFDPLRNEPRFQRLIEEARPPGAPVLP